MSWIARLKSLAGGAGYPVSKLTLTAAATVNVPGFSNVFYMSGTDTITSLVGESSTRMREVTFIGSSGTTTFTNTNNPTTAGQIDLGGSNFALASTDVLRLILQPNGTWLRVAGTDN